jgi:hypothetical protein
VTSHKAATAIATVAAARRGRALTPAHLPLRSSWPSQDRAREQKLQLRAAEWFESTGDTRQAIRYFLAAQQADRALALLQDRVAADFLLDPTLPGPLDLSMVDPSSLTDAPDQRGAGGAGTGVV